MKTGSGISDSEAPPYSPPAYLLRRGSSGPHQGRILIKQGIRAPHIPPTHRSSAHNTPTSHGTTPFTGSKDSKTSSDFYFQKPPAGPPSRPLADLHPIPSAHHLPSPQPLHPPYPTKETKIGSPPAKKVSLSSRNKKKKRIQNKPQKKIRPGRQSRYMNK